MKYCSVPACRTLVHTGRCATHARPAWRDDTGSGPPRVRGRELQRRRASLFTRSPLCVLCLAKQRLSAATIRDHVVPLAEGGTDEETNVQAICVDCHTEKTQREALRGKARAL